jgi:HPt (histidine-containing phosphotransfer) domain-containing protein
MMQKGDDQSPRQVWNLAELLARVDNDQELLNDLLDIFKEEFPRIKQSLQAAVAGGDLKNTASLSHTLKGMLASLGGERAAAAASRLEELASAGQHQAVRAALETLEREAVSLLPQLEAYKEEVRH